MMKFFAPSPNGFVSGGNIFNQQIVKALRELKCKVKYADYNQGWFDASHKEVLMFDSILVNELDSDFLKGTVNKKIFLIHLLPSMIGQGQGQEFEKQLLSIFDLIVVNSTYSKEYITTNFGLHKSVLVNPFIDLPEEFERNPIPGKAIMVANWLPAKQIDIFLSILSTKDIPKELKIHILGDNSLDKPYFEKCLSIIKQSESLKKSIVLEKPMPHDELWYEFDTAELFIDTSSFETYGMAVAEAVAAKVPVLTLGNGNVKNLVPRDAICTKMEELIERMISRKWTPMNTTTENHEIITEWSKFKAQLLPLTEILH